MIVIWILIWVVILSFGFIVLRGAPYVPSRRRYIERAFTALYPLGKKDVLVDIGSGDGIVLRIASEHGATAIGYELNPILVIISRVLSRRHKQASVILADFWLTPLPDNTTVVYAFTVTRDIKKMTRRITSESTRLGRPIRLISYGNTLPGVTLDGAIDAYTLYTITPLQIDKP
jgi:hypothetical protein